MGSGRDRGQSADRRALSQQQDRQAQRGSCLVAGRAGGGRPDGRGHVQPGSGVADQAGRGLRARPRAHRVVRRLEISAHRARRRRHPRARHVPRTGEPAVPDPVLRDVPDRGFRAGAGPMGGSGAEPHRTHAGHSAAGLRQRIDVPDAPLRRAAGAPAVAHRRAVVLVPGRRARPVRAQRREFSGDGAAGRHRMGHRRVLYVAHHAGHGLRALSPRRRAADGPDGDGRNIVHPVCFAYNGLDFRSQEDRTGRERRGLPGSASRTRARPHPGHRGADFVSRCGGAARAFAAGVRRDLVP